MENDLLTTEVPPRNRVKSLAKAWELGRMVAAVKQIEANAESPPHADPFADNFKQPNENLSPPPKPSINRQSVSQNEPGFRRLVPSSENTAHNEEILGQKKDVSPIRSVIKEEKQKIEDILYSQENEEQNSISFAQNQILQSPSNTPTKKRTPPPPPPSRVRDFVSPVVLQMPAKAAEVFISEPPPLPPRPSPARNRIRSENMLGTSIRQNDPFSDSSDSQLAIDYPSAPIFSPFDDTFDEDGDSDDDEEDETALESETLAAGQFSSAVISDFTTPNRSIPVPNLSSGYNPDITLRSQGSPRTIAVGGLSICYSNFSNAESLIRVASFRISDSSRKIPVFENSKVTAICFLPNLGEDNGNTRRVWVALENCEIHAFIADMPGRPVLDHPYERQLGQIHSAPVVSLLSDRFRRSVWSLDDSGVFAIWQQTDSYPYISLQSRPLVRRTSPRQTCAHVHTYSQSLWSSYQKSLSIFSIPLDSSFRVDVSRFGGNITGISSVSSRNSVVTSHDDGKIVIWDSPSTREWRPIPIKTFEPALFRSVTSVLMVSDSHLWVGLVTGIIKIYQIPDQNSGDWILIKEFMAFHNAAIIGLCENGLICERDVNEKWMVSAIADNSQIRLFDGLLKQDWIDNKLNSMEHQFATYREISVFIGSWNLDSRKPEHLKERDPYFFRRWLSTADGYPEIVVFGLQEMIDLESKKNTAKQLFKGPSKKPKNPDSLASSSRSLLWRDYLSECLEQYGFKDRISYRIVECREMVGLFVIAFARYDALSSCSNAAVSMVQTGLRGYHGNKGSISLRLFVDDSSFCFVDCHLAAHQSHISARNNDAAIIMRDTLFRDTNTLSRASFAEKFYVNGGDGSRILDHENIFWFGDLNYRIDLSRDRVLDLIRQKDWNTLMKHDQLFRQKKENSLFVLKNMEEGQLLFPPTFKFDPGRDTYDSSDKKRIPAWCDRVLWQGTRIKQLQYTSLDCRISDHRPVVATFIVQVRKIDRTLRSKILSKDVDPMWEKYSKDSIQKLHG